MTKDKCPECGQSYINPDGRCLNPDCTAFSAENKGFRIPSHGWGSALLLMIVLCVIVAVVLTIVPSKYTGESDETDDADTSKVASKIEKITSGESDTEIILAQGSTEAPADEDNPEPPGGLTWEELRFPGSERLINYSGRKLKDDEQAYVTGDKYENVKKFYVGLIESAFYKQPQMVELVDKGLTKLTLQNQTGSLSVWVTSAEGSGKVYILVTRIENIAGENLKPFGGPPKEREK